VQPARIRRQASSIVRLNLPARFPSICLVIAGLAIPWIGSGPSVTAIVALWAAATCAVSIGILWVKPSLQWRVVAGIAAIPCLFLLGFEGGWWLIPAVIVDTIISVRLARTALTQRAA
jgi:hypothetical protein